MPPPPDAAALVATTIALLRTRDADASICPSDVVRRLWRASPITSGRTDDGWRHWMPAVRRVAADLAARDVLRITRGTEAVAPDAARLGGGPIRLRRGPCFGDPTAAGPPEPAA